MKELCDYIIRILDNLFSPNITKTEKPVLTAPLDIPFVQKAAVKILILLVRTRAIYPVRPADEPETETQGLTEGVFRISAAPAAEKNGNGTGEKPMGTAGFCDPALRRQRNYRRLCALCPEDEGSGTDPHHNCGQ